MPNHGPKTWPGAAEPFAVAWDWDWVHGWSRKDYAADLIERLGNLESRLKKLEEALHGKHADGQTPPEGER